MKLIVPLRRDEFARLAKLARTERRQPQEQAAFLLSRALAACPAGSDQCGHEAAPRADVVEARQ